MTILTGDQVAAERLDGWVLLAGVLHTRAVTGDFATGLRFVDAVGAAAEERNHHPDVDLRYGHVDVRLVSHDAGGVTERDVDLARAVGAMAADAGVALRPAGLSRLELGLDTPDHEAVLPFWAAVLGMDRPRKGPDDEVRDPSGVLPTVWFQRSGAEEPRQRWHPDVWVDPDEVRPRIDAAVDAGGSLVDDGSAPAYWVLADPEGNRVCLCTWRGRDPRDG